VICFFWKRHRCRWWMDHHPRGYFSYHLPYGAGE